MKRRTIAIATLVCSLLLGLYALPGRAEEPAQPVLPEYDADRSRVEAIFAALSVLDLDTAPEAPASPFEPPGRPSDRPIGSPPGQGDPPDPPGRPEDRPIGSPPGQNQN